MADRDAEGVDTLILACGNPLRGDDGVGPIAAGQIELALTDEERLRHRVLVVHQLLPELALALSEVKRAVLIDARVPSDESAGTVRVEAVEPQRDADKTQGTSLTHHWTLPRLLAVAEALYGRAPEAATVSVVASGFDSPDSLSDPVIAALPEAVARVLELVRCDRPWKLRGPIL